MTASRTTKLSLSVLAVLGAVVCSASSDASAADAFGPIDSRSFLLRSGTTIERPGANCDNNSDVLLIKGANVRSMKSSDITPKVWSFDNQSQVPTNDCVAPNCAQIYIGVRPTTPVGTRTVTLKSADGRTLTTTFDVVENTTGRCDKKKS